MLAVTDLKHTVSRLINWGRSFIKQKYHTLINNNVGQNADVPRARAKAARGPGENAMPAVHVHLIPGLVQR